MKYHPNFQVRGLRLLAATSVFLTSIAWANLAPSGDLDPTFNTTGNVVTNVTTRNTFSDASGSVVQPDGRIVVAGDYDAGGGLVHISVTRYNPDGSVDGSFGSGGEVKSVLSNNDLVTGVALTTDGKIVVVGSAQVGGSEDFFAARFTSTGAVDTTFNGTGFITVEVGTNSTGPCFDRAQAVTVQADNKIVVAGYSDNITAAHNNGRDASFIRLNTNGTLDSSFGSGGKVLVQFVPDATTSVERALAVTVQPVDQKIVAGGRGSSTQFSLLRLNTNGTLDTGFGSGGKVLGTFGGSSGPDRFQALQIDSSGRIVGAGMRYPGVFHMAVARFLSNGSFDTSFNGSGWNSVNIIGGAGQDQCRAVGIQPSDGKILCSGVADSDNSGNFKMFAARFNVNGTLDSSYATGGAFVIDASGSGQENDARASVMQSDSKYMIVGTAYPPASVTSTEIAAVRLTTGGALDTTFNGTGIVFRQLQGGSTDYAYGVAAQSDGKLVVAGSTADSTSGNIVVARYNTNGSLDTGFGVTGLVTTGLPTYNEDGRAVLVQPDQKIVVGGMRLSLTPPSPPHQLIALRYNSNGTLDTTFGSGGIASAPLGTNGGAGRAIARQSDGKILVAGSYTNAASDWNFYVARFTTAGALDPTFGSAGTANISVGTVDEAQAIGVQSDGKILLAGYATVSGGEEFALVRLSANGTVDATFGSGGIVKTSVGDTANQRNRFTGIVQLPDGRILAGGTGNDGVVNSVPVFRLVRYNANGTLDTTYGSNGISNYSIVAGTRYSNMYALALQFDEKVVAFGDTTLLPGGTQDFALARFNWDDGSIDTSYGSNGQVIDVITPGLDGGYSGTLLSDGRQVMAGLAQQSDLGVARFRADPAPTLPGVPDLTSDSGSSTTDNITNVNKPTLNAACNVGDTVWLKIDGAITTPPTRAICRANPQPVTLPSALADGSHSISAFARNGSGDSASSAALAITIDTVANAVSISAPAVGANILPNPNVTGAGAESGATIKVTEAGNPVCSTTAAGDGSWSCAATLGQGAHSISVTQTDIAGNTSAAATRAFTVKLATTTSVQTSIVPSVYGQTVIFTASVAAASGTPSGNVVFSIDGGAGQTVALVSGAAPFSIASLAPGVHTVDVAYTETAGYFGSSGSLPGGQSIVAANTQTSLQTSAGSVPVGTQVSFTATVVALAPGAGTPTGNITFTDGGSPIAGCSAVAVDGAGTAVCSTSSLSVGARTIAANFVNADANYNPSSGTIAQTVRPIAPSSPLLDVSSDSGSSNSDNVTNAATPLLIGTCVTGDAIQLFDGAPIGSSLVCTSGAYAENVALGEGVHQVSAVATRNSASSSASTPPLLLTIDRSVLAPVVNSPADLALRNPDVGGTGEIGARVTLKENTTTLCTTTVDNTGNWSCATTLSTVGAHTVKATQTDIAGNASAASPDFIVTIDQIYVDGFDGN